MGIIDYLRFYTWDKETEHYLKYLLKGGMVPTIVNPGDYRKRFLKAINKYFISVWKYILQINVHNNKFLS